jgi:hypothetical protein
MEYWRDREEREEGKTRKGEEILIVDVWLLYRMLGWLLP